MRQGPDDMSVQFKHATLDNGLTILAEVDDAAHTAAAGFFVRTGARDEPRPLMGVSHFLEHMMFKGTTRRSAAEVNRDFDRIGANYNASTSHETTLYYAHVLPEYTPQAIDLLADILRPALREEDFATEKKVILEEIGMYADRPFWVVYEQALERFYGRHPLSYRVLGTNESITALTRDQMHEYFSQRYSPDNMVVSLAGRVDFESCVQQIARDCGRWHRTGARRDYNGALGRAEQATLHKEQANMHYLVGITPGPSAQDDQRYAAAVLSQVIGDSDNSRLYWELVEPGLTEELDFSHQPHDHTGTFLFYASCRPENAAEVERRLLSVLDRAAEGFQEREVERAVSKIAMDLTLQNERPAGRMMALGGQWLYLGEYLPMSEVLRKVQAVTPDDLKSLVQQYPFHPRTIVRMAPGAA
jgi:predicted Zn-dependent peptidase